MRIYGHVRRDIGVVAVPAGESISAENRIVRRSGIFARVHGLGLIYRTAIAGECDGILLPRILRRDRHVSRDIGVNTAPAGKGIALTYRIGRRRGRTSVIDGFGFQHRAVVIREGHGMLLDADFLLLLDNDSGEDIEKRNRRTTRPSADAEVHLIRAACDLQRPGSILAGTVVRVQRVKDVVGDGLPVGKIGETAQTESALHDHRDAIVRVWRYVEYTQSVGGGAGRSAGNTQHLIGKADIAGIIAVECRR